MWNAICDLSEYMEYIRQTGDIENMKRMRIEKRYDVRKKRGSKGDGGSQKSIAEMGRSIENMFLRHFPSRESLPFLFQFPSLHSLNSSPGPRTGCPPQRS